MKQGLPVIPVSPSSALQLLGIQALSCSQLKLQEQGYMSLLSTVLCQKSMTLFSLSELLPQWDCSRFMRVENRQLSQQPRFS